MQALSPQSSEKWEFEEFSGVRVLGLKVFQGFRAFRAFRVTFRVLGLRALGF